MPYEVQVKELPAQHVVEGEIGPAYHTLTGWVQEHGHQVAGPPREVYLTSPEAALDPADYLTEIVFPIR